LTSEKASKALEDRGKIIKKITIALLCFGVILAFLFAYQQFNRTPVTSEANLIPRESAIQIALKAGDWNNYQDQQTSAGNRHIVAILVHVQSNGVGLIVDESTLQDMSISAGKYNGFENQYIWDIKISGYNNSADGNNKLVTHSWINAESGQVLNQG